MAVDTFCVAHKAVQQAMYSMVKDQAKMEFAIDHTIWSALSEEEVS
jgi:hypothetical protein